MILDFLFYLSIVVLGGIGGYLIRDYQRVESLVQVVEHHNETMERYHAALIVLRRHDLEHEYRDVLEEWDNLE